MKTDNIPKNCTTCAFQYKCNKGKSMYCSLKKFPILNPEIGCSRQMFKSEFRNNKTYMTAEEIAAASEAQYEGS